MNIVTTINICTKSMDRLDKAAIATGKSRSALLILIIKMKISQHHILPVKNISIRYQDRLPKRYWHRMHISVSDKDYELLLDLRNFSKFSVSFLVSHAIDEYLEKAIVNLLHRKNYYDNYHNIYYKIIKETTKDMICWKIYWGKPENHYRANSSNIN